MLSIKFPSNDKARFSPKPHQYHYQKEPFTSSTQLLKVLQAHNTFFAVTHEPYSGTNSTSSYNNTISELDYDQNTNLLYSGLDATYTPPAPNYFNYYQQSDPIRRDSLNQAMVRSEYSHIIILDLDYKPELYSQPAIFTKQQVIDALLTFANYVVYAPSQSSEGDTPNGRYFVPLTKPVNKRQIEGYLQELFYKQLGATFHASHYKNAIALYDTLVKGRSYEGNYLHECLDTAAFRPTQKLNTYDNKPYELYTQEGQRPLTTQIPTINIKDISRRTNHQEIPHKNDLADKTITEYLSHMEAKDHKGKTGYDRAKEHEEGNISEDIMVNLSTGVDCTVREWIDNHNNVQKARFYAPDYKKKDFYLYRRRGGDDLTITDFKGTATVLTVIKESTSQVVEHQLDTYVTKVPLRIQTVIEAPTGSGKTYKFKDNSNVVLLLPTNKQVESMAKEGFTPVTSNPTDSFESNPMTITGKAIAMTFDKFAGHLASDVFVEWLADKLIVIDEFPLLFTAQRSGYAHGRDRLLAFLRDTEYYHMKRVFLSANMDAYKILEDLGFDGLLVHRFLKQQPLIIVTPLSPKHKIPELLTKNAFIFTNSLSKISAYDDMIVVTSESDLGEVTKEMANTDKSVIFTSVIREGISFHGTKFDHIIVDASVNREDPTGADQALQAMARPRNSEAKRYIYVKKGASKYKKLTFNELLRLAEMLESHPHLVEELDMYKPILEELRRARLSDEKIAGWAYSRIILMGIVLKKQALYESYAEGMLDALAERGIETTYVDLDDINKMLSDEEKLLKPAVTTRKDWASYKDLPWEDMTKLLDNPNIPEVRRARIAYLMDNPTLDINNVVYTLTSEAKAEIVNNDIVYTRIKHLSKPETYNNEQITKLYGPTSSSGASQILNKVYEGLKLSGKIGDKGLVKFLNKVGLEVQWLDSDGGPLKLIKGARGKHLHYIDKAGNTYKLNKNKDPTGAYLKVGNPFEWLRENSTTQEIEL